VLHDLTSNIHNESGTAFQTSGGSVYFTLPHRLQMDSIISHEVQLEFTGFTWTPPGSLVQKLSQGLEQTWRKIPLKNITLDRN